MKPERRKAGAQPKPITFKRVPNPSMRYDCIEVTSHAKDRKGYVRIRPRTGKRETHVNVHRLAYMSKHGPNSIPEGWEVDHICGNRACVNRSHLRVLSRSEHKAETNRHRYSALEEAARCYWLATGCTGRELGQRYGRGQTTGNRWIRRWLEEGDTPATLPKAA